MSARAFEAMLTLVCSAGWLVGQDPAAENRVRERRWCKLMEPQKYIYRYSPIHVEKDLFHLVID